MMPKKPMKSTGKVAPSKVTKPSKMSSTGSKKMASKYGEKPPVVGPATKKEAKKSVPKVPMTSAGTAAMNAEKKKSRIQSAKAIVGSVGTAIGGMLADARLQRGANRVRGGRANVKVSVGDAWRAGKNKKSTK